MNEEVKLNKARIQPIGVNTPHNAQVDMKLQVQYKETFSEIHAPEALAGKVRNMTKVEKKKESSFAKKLVTVAAALAVLFVGSNGVVYAATGSTWIGGIFKDITNWSGAVVGQEYVQATNEVGMSVSVAVVNNETILLPVEMKFHKKDEAPFRYIEEVELENYKVLDEAGKVVVSSEEANAIGNLTDGVAEIMLPVDGGQLSQNMEYTLVVESFYGHSKADAPIEIKGNWECKFAIGENN